MQGQELGPPGLAGSRESLSSPEFQHPKSADSQPGTPNPIHPFNPSSNEAS